MPVPHVAMWWLVADMLTVATLINGSVALRLPRPPKDPAMEAAKERRRNLDQTFVAISVLELEVGRPDGWTDWNPIIIRLKELENQATALAASDGASGRALERSLRADILDPRSGATFAIAHIVETLSLPEELQTQIEAHVTLASDALDRELGLSGPVGSDGWADSASPPIDASARAFRALDGALHRIADRLGDDGGVQLLTYWSVARFPELAITDSVTTDVARLICERADSLSKCWLKEYSMEPTGEVRVSTETNIVREIEEAVEVVRAAMAEGEE